MAVGVGNYVLYGEPYPNRVQKRREKASAYPSPEIGKISSSRIRATASTGPSDRGGWAAVLICFRFALGDRGFGLFVRPAFLPASCLPIAS